MKNVRYMNSRDYIAFFLVLALFRVFGILNQYLELGFTLLLLLSKIKQTRLLRIQIKNKYYVWMLSFLMFSLVSIVWCSNTEAVLYGTRGVLECFLVGIALISYIETQDEIIKVFKFMLISGVLLIVEIFITVPIADILSRNMTGNFNPNTVGIKLANNVLILLWLKKQRIHISGFYKISSIFFLAMIVLTGSKKAIFVLVMGVIILLFFHADNPLELFKVLIIVNLGLFIMYWLMMNNSFLYQTVGKRIEGMYNAYKYGSVYGDASTFERMNLISDAMNAWRKRPWIGYGINTYSYVSSYGMYTHNNYIELLFGLGIIGTCIYYSFFVWILNKTMHSIKNNSFAEIFLAVILIIIACDYGMVSYGDEYIQCWIALSSAFVALGVGNAEAVVENGNENIV